MCFTEKMSMAALKKIDNSAHWEPRRGNHKQAKDYSTKEETRVSGPWQEGEEPSQGKRTDLAAIYDMVKSKKTNAEMLEATNGAAARFEKAINFTRFTLQETESDRQITGIRVICLFGGTGVGKTYAAVNLMCNKTDYYIAECPSTSGSKLWFNGYEGQKCLILDDFSGSFCDFRFLLRLLDVYKLKVEVKGGFAWATWTTVIITTNIQPGEWYPIGIDLAPLKRRIHEIRHVEERGFYTLLDWDGHTVGDITPLAPAPPPPAASQEIGEATQNVPDSPAAIPTGEYRVIRDQLIPDEVSSDLSEDEDLFVPPKSAPIIID